MKRRSRNFYQSQKKLSILHIVLSIGETNATYNEHCLPLADEYDISICTYFKSDLCPPKSITFFDSNGSLISYFRNLKAALDSKEYDIIHVHSPHVGLLFRAATLITHRKYASSTVVTVHDSYPNYKLRNRIMLLLVFASFHRVVCCSQSSFDSFPTFYKLLAGGRMRVVQNGLDLARVDRVAANTRPRPVQTSDFTINAISRLVDIKNPFSVLSAFQQSAEGNGRTSRLVYIGNGPLRNSLITKSKQIGLENQIEFLGLIPREQVFEHLLRADLFISTSRGEGLPVAVLEAMACGCPVLLSDIPPHREIAEGTDFIPLIKPDDVVGFTREIKKFREMSVSDRALVGQNCRKLIEERFSLPAMHAGYEEVYAQITGNRAP